MFNQNSPLQDLKVDWTAQQFKAENESMKYLLVVQKPSNNYLVLILNISKTAGSGALESEIKRGG